MNGKNEWVCLFVGVVGGANSVFALVVISNI